MAGILKPLLASSEGQYKFLGGLGNQSSSPRGLFNGTSSNNWDTDDVMYWQNANHYLDVELYEKCNLWRCGSTSWKESNGKLKILKFNDSTNSYVDVTTNYTQNLTQITHLEWEKYIDGMEIGKYRFSFNGSARLDSEWFFETTPKKRMIFKNQQTSQLYSISDKTLIQLYNSTNETIIKYGIEEGKEIDLSVDFDNVEYSVVGKSGKVTITGKPLSIKFE